MFTNENLEMHTYINLEHFLFFISANVDMCTFLIGQRILMLLKIYKFKYATLVPLDVDTYIMF